jgi:hypothetical protein
MIRFHYHRQTWLPHREQRRWRGFGVTVWAREFSVKWGQP